MSNTETKIKAGKKPISSKPEPDFQVSDSPFGNALSLPEKFVKDVRSAGYELRFINLKRLNDYSGFHPKAWEPYLPSKFGNIEKGEFHRGSHPDGKIIRGDCVLAVRPISIGDQHRAQIERRRRALSGQEAKNARELKAMGEKIGSKITTEYDD